MLNPCCKKTLGEFNNKLADIATELIKLSGKRESVMEEAMYRRAEIIADIMDNLKNFAQSKMKG